MASDQVEPHPFLFDLLSKSDYKLLQDHYRRITFKDPVDESLRCSLCERVPIDHFVGDQCDHIYCNYCCNTIYNKLNNHCPKCYQNCGYMSGRVIEKTLKVLALDVYCPNRQNGCTFFSTYLEMADHIHGCLKADEVQNPIEFANELEDEIVLKYATKFTWTLGDTRELERQLRLSEKHKVASPSTPCLSHPFSFNLSYNVRSGRICIKIMHSDRTEKFMGRPFPRVKYTFRDATQKSEKVYYREAQLLFTETLENEKEYYASYIKFDLLREFETIAIGVEMNVIMDSVWLDGVYNWEINDYSEKFVSERDEIVSGHYTPIFYTKRKEYAVMAELSVYEEKTLWVKIISGPNDGALVRDSQRFLVLVDFEVLGLPEPYRQKTMAKLSDGPIVRFPLTFLRQYLPEAEHKFKVSIVVKPVLPAKLKLRPGLKRRTFLWYKFYNYDQVKKENLFYGRAYNFYNDDQV